jgi:hypothetical protein
MQLKCLIIGFVWPEPNSSAAGKRMMQLIHSLLKHDFIVCFATQSIKGEYSIDLDAIGVETFSIKVNDSAFDSFIKKLDPQVVIFDRFIMEEQFGWRVAENCPKALRILDTEDLHFLRKERQLKFKKKEVEFFSDHAKREISAIFRCDFSLIISQVEMDLLFNNYQVSKERVMYLPMWSEDSKSYSAFENRKNFVFIGNFMHDPNLDAVKFLKEEIWQKIRLNVPESELHIYGAYPTDKVFQLTDKKVGFIIKGRAENVDQLCQQYRVMLAPLRFGAGVKGKFIDAMRNGLPSLTTSIGAESLCNSNDWPGFVTDNFDLYVEQAIEIYSSETRWAAESHKGLTYHDSNFTEKNWPSVFVNNIQYYLEHIEYIRKNNFIGELLLHQIHQSTKYMSKWIELKNQISNQS